MKPATQQPKFRTNYTDNCIKSKPSSTRVMTVPGQALTNKEHVKKARQGLSDQTVKLIYDPQNIYPDVRAMDLVDKRKMLQGARALVNDLREKGRIDREAFEKAKAEREQGKVVEMEKLIQKQLDKDKLKGGHK